MENLKKRRKGDVIVDDDLHLTRIDHIIRRDFFPHAPQVDVSNDPLLAVNPSLTLDEYHARHISEEGASFSAVVDRDAAGRGSGRSRDSATFMGHDRGTRGAVSRANVLAIDAKPHDPSDEVDDDDNDDDDRPSGPKTAGAREIEVVLPASVPRSALQGPAAQRRGGGGNAVIAGTVRREATRFNGEHEDVAFRGPAPGVRPRPSPLQRAPGSGDLTPAFWERRRPGSVSSDGYTPSRLEKDRLANLVGESHSPFSTDDEGGVDRSPGGALAAAGMTPRIGTATDFVTEGILALRSRNRSGAQRTSKEEEGKGAPSSGDTPRDPADAAKMRGRVFRPPTAAALARLHPLTSDVTPPGGRSESPSVAGTSSAVSSRASSTRSRASRRVSARRAMARNMTPAAASLLSRLGK